eukprot:CAMPEP_0170366450 /NCGR_PEP_ID=MMETSP0117_2-20130122/6424_1 /TAXON_ID=400756 /ORGANISM="Durinskia baltica, Strain CSIRO CS-38" /LENGTH=611 /DNA_ID=CAMNT_0010621039 /DNA_START=39 /DNA_END=1874 /DNA_ORIENTATION=-
MAQILQPYRVPVIYNDLTPEETMADAFYALETLSATIDDIFGRIERRISDERTRIDHVKNRVKSCKHKVEQVRGSNKATTVFSTAKFPGPKDLPAYPTLFSQIHEMRSPFREVDEEVQYLPPHPAYSAVGNRELSGELHDIMSRLNTYGTDLERVEFIMEDCGLGKVPHGVQSVGSLLLFNSNINPYKDYQTLDNLISAGREKNVGNDVTGKQLASAPTTIMDGDALPDIEGLDLTYKPSMGEMSSLALPENLPLDFIANIQFSAALDLPSIAPSAHMANKANYSLPQLTDGNSSGSATASAYAPPPSAKAGNNTPPPSSAGAPPPPPPPPPPMAAQSANAPPPPPPPPQSAATAPPPPPPPLPQPVVMDGAEEQCSSTPTGPAGAGSKPGLSFLDSIKGMSVGKLRSKEESALSAAKVQKKVEQTKPLTMAEALKERLARRNGALSGKNEKEDKRRDSLIVQAARQQQQQTVPSAVKKTGLVSVGFAAVNASDNNDDYDDAIGYAKPGFSQRRNDSDGSESDTVSEFSEDSRAFAAPKPKQSFTTPSLRNPAAAAGPSAPSPQAPPLPMPERRGSGLLDSSNTAVANLLSQSQNRAMQAKDDGSEDDDWD